MRAPQPAGLLSPEWYDAIGVRLSRRRFTSEPIAHEAAEQLRQFCHEFRPFDDVRVAFIEHAPGELFTGLVGSYGRIEGAPSAVLLVGPRDAKTEVGYVGEALVLEATCLGLDSCWIAGAFSRKRAATLIPLEAGEHVPAIVALGIAEKTQGLSERTMRSFVRASSRLPLEELARTVAGVTWPDWAITAVEAARRAPSGGNSQPWRFRLEQGTLVLSRAKVAYPTVALDLGIAMLHAELGAQHEGVAGRWERLGGDDIARFVPEQGA